MATPFDSKPTPFDTKTTPSPSGGMSYQAPSGKGGYEVSPSGQVTTITYGRSGGGGQTPSQLVLPETPAETIEPQPFVQPAPAPQAKTIVSQLQNVPTGISPSGLYTQTNPLLQNYDVTTVPLKPYVAPTLVSQVSQLFGYGEVVPAKQFVTNQKAFQDYNFQVQTQKQFVANPQSFENKTGVFLQSVPQGTQYTLTSEYFKTYQPKYNITSPLWQSYAADINLGLSQAGAEISHWERNLVVSALSNEITSPSSSKDYFPMYSSQSKIVSIPSYSKVPIEVAIGVAGIAAGGYGTFTNIKNLGVSEGVVSSLESFSPIRMNRQFYSDIDYSTLAKTLEFKQDNLVTQFTTMSSGEDVTGLTGESIGTTKARLGSFQVSKIDEESLSGISIQSKGFYSTKYTPTISGADFTIKPMTQQSMSIFKFPNENLKPAGAIINNVPMIGTYSEGDIYTITKQNEKYFPSTSKGYGIRVGGKSFVYNVGDVEYTPTMNIKGTKATLGIDVLKPKISGYGFSFESETPSREGYSFIGKGSSKSSFGFQETELISKTTLKTPPVISFVKSDLGLGLKTTNQFFSPSLVSKNYQTTKSIQIKSTPQFTTTRTIMKPSSKYASVITTVQSPTFAQTSRQFFATTTTQVQLQTPAQTTTQISVSKMADITRLIPPTMTFGNFKYPTMGAFGIPSLGGTQLFAPQKKKGKKRKPKIAPSFTAEAFNIVGKIPKSGKFGISPFKIRKLPRSLSFKF